MSITVTFPLTGQSQFTTSVVINEAEFRHSLATIALPGSQAGSDFVHGTPVNIMWTGRRGDPVEWYGYVDTLQQTTNRTQQAVSSAICVGMTYPLKEQRQDVWTNVTGDGVAEALAARWRLGVDLEADARVWPSVPQAGASDWELLVSIAHQIGFTCYSRGPLLCFYTRTRDVAAYASFAPIFEYIPQDPTSGIVSFQPLSSSSQDTNKQVQLTTIDSTGSVLQMANTDGTGSLLASVDTLPSFTTVNTTTAGDAQEAAAMLTAQAEDQRFHIRAKVVVMGDTRLRPALPVYLSGLPTQWNGSWFVLGVKHLLNPATNQSVGRDSYLCELLVGRDGMGPSSVIPNGTFLDFSDHVTAEIGNTGLWQCGPFVQIPEEAPPPAFVTERLAALGL